MLPAEYLAKYNTRLLWLVYTQSIVHSPAIACFDSEKEAYAFSRKFTEFEEGYAKEREGFDTYVWHVPFHTKES